LELVAYEVTLSVILFYQCLLVLPQCCDVVFEIPAMPYLSFSQTMDRVQQNHCRSSNKETHVTLLSCLKIRLHSIPLISSLSVEKYGSLRQDECIVLSALERETGAARVTSHTDKVVCEILLAEKWVFTCNIVKYV
jgi:hypothetical protein